MHGVPMNEEHGSPAGGASRIPPRDLAALAGVSRTTVSHALSGRGRVRASTRQRIRDLAAEVGFVPSATALALKTGRTGVLAIVNATRGGSLEYFMVAATAASYAALEAGYAPALVPTEGQETWVRQLAMDGAIVLDPLDDDPIMRVLDDRRRPVVTIGDEPRSSPWSGPMVRTDRAAGTSMVLDHLWDRGARRPGLVIGRESRRWIVETSAAYTRWMHEHGLEPAIAEATEADPGRAGYQAAHHLLRDPGVDAVYVPFDPMLDGVLAAIGDHRLEVPGELRIVVQEGMRARGGHPALTALDDRPGEVARIAMTALLDQLSSPGAATQTTLVRPHLIVRHTT